MRLLVLLLCSLSIVIIHAQADEILIEPEGVTHIEINEPELEIDVFFDAELDQIVQIVGDTSHTNGQLHVTSIAIYSPDDDELMTITSFYSPSFTFKPFRVKTSGRYRVHFIAKESAQVEIRYKVRETPHFEDSINSHQDGLYSTVESLDYIFTADAGDIITSYVQTKSFDAVLTLYDPNGDLIATDDDSYGELNPIIDQFELINSGTYRLVVHSYKPDGEGQFTIFLQHNPVPIYPLIAYDEPVSVSLDGEKPLYTFQFDGSAGDVLALHIDDPDNIAFVRITRIYDADLINTDESATRLYNQWDRFVLPKNETYNLVVVPREKGTSGDIALEIEHLASQSLEAGEISAHVSDKDPIQHFTFMGYSNASATITINQSNYDASTMPYRVTVLTPNGSIMNQMTIDNFVGSFSQTNTFGTGRLPNGEVTIEIEMLGEGPAWFDVSVNVVSGMG